MEGYSGPRGPSLKAFYLVIQVCHLLWAGQITSAKPHLKQLQACFHEINTEPPHPGTVRVCVFVPVCIAHCRYLCSVVCPYIHTYVCTYDIVHTYYVHM